MKKILMVVLALIMALSFTACGKKKELTEDQEYDLRCLKECTAELDFDEITADNLREWNSSDTKLQFLDTYMESLNLTTYTQDGITLKRYDFNYTEPETNAYRVSCMAIKDFKEDGGTRRVIIDTCDGTYGQSKRRFEGMIDEKTKEPIGTWKATLLRNNYYIDIIGTVVNGKFEGEVSFDAQYYCFGAKGEITVEGGQTIKYDYSDEIENHFEYTATETLTNGLISEERIAEVADKYVIYGKVGETIHFDDTTKEKDFLDYFYRTGYQFCIPGYLDEGNKVFDLIIT